MIAWDGQGRAFFGSESSDDPAGTPKTFGDVWVARFVRPLAGRGCAPRRQAVRGDERGRARFVGAELAREVQRQDRDRSRPQQRRRCDKNVYFSWSRFSGNAGGVGIYFVRSTDHGATFSNPQKLSQTFSDVQFPDIAITGNDDVYVFFRSFASGRGHQGDASTTSSPPIAAQRSRRRRC